jgi:hypothetical protein
MKLSLLSVLLGVGVGLPQVYGLVKPAQLATAARKFPRNLVVGIVLMLLGTAWFVWNVQGEPIADFSAFKPYMIGGFIAVGVLSCIFIQDFLAVRGLAVVLMLLGKLMVDTGRPYLPTTMFHAQPGETTWVLVVQAWAYVLIIAGIWFTITPWRLRDLLNWATANETRTRQLSAVRLAFAAFIVILGLTAFRSM